mmetsp:Transcript_44570/g.110955  ORF Transcript_44570/g.110955 Transcript_44570/m.110955 type:complete len:294 (+) Transcript_44570:498-1379(+)
MATSETHDGWVERQECLRSIRATLGRSDLHRRFGELVEADAAHVGRPDQHPRGGGCQNASESIGRVDVDVRQALPRPTARAVCVLGGRGRARPRLPPVRGLREDLREREGVLVGPWDDVREDEKARELLGEEGVAAQLEDRVRDEQRLRGGAHDDADLAPHALPQHGEPRGRGERAVPARPRLETRREPSAARAGVGDARGAASRELAVVRREPAAPAVVDGAEGTPAALPRVAHRLGDRRELRAGLRRASAGVAADGSHPLHAARDDAVGGALHGADDEQRQVGVGADGVRE